MAYIGNPPADRYSKLAKQDLTGDGTVGAYTLDYAVGSAAEIEVFVNHVRQEPTTAYTVAGDQLTMTGTVASTDDFYVVFQGKAIASGQVPEKQSDGSYVYLGDVDINGNELILDADADTSITADTDDQIDIKIGGSDVASFTSNGLKMVSGKGIDFSATSDTAATGASMASELFDDYEEGTWTPTVSTGTISVVTNSAHYIKIGKLVVAHCRISNFSDTTSGIQVTISGLPYPIGTNQVHAGVGWTDNAIKQIFFYGGTVGNSSVDAYAGGSGYDSFGHNEVNSGDNFIITFNYITQ